MGPGALCEDRPQRLPVGWCPQGPGGRPGSTRPPGRGWGGASLGSSFLRRRRRDVSCSPAATAPLGPSSLRAP